MYNILPLVFPCVNYFYLLRQYNFTRELADRKLAFAESVIVKVLFYQKKGFLFRLKSLSFDKANILFLALHSKGVKSILSYFFILFRQFILSF